MPSLGMTAGGDDLNLLHAVITDDNAKLEMPCRIAKCLPLTTACPACLSEFETQSCVSKAYKTQFHKAARGIV